jgi:hypothetical protein
VDTLLFALILGVALLVVFSRKRWLIVTAWTAAAVAVLALFAVHATDVLKLSL